MPQYKFLCEKWDEPTKQNFINLVNQGTPIKELAETFNLDKKTIQNNIEFLGLPMPPTSKSKLPKFIQQFIIDNYADFTNGELTTMLKQYTGHMVLNGQIQNIAINKGLKKAPHITKPKSNYSELSENEKHHKRAYSTKRRLAADFGYIPDDTNCLLLYYNKQTNRNRRMERRYSDVLQFLPQP